MGRPGIDGPIRATVDVTVEPVTETSAAGRRKVRGYSLGMRQRLALATALLGDPAALILDEPANGLDPEGIAWLRGLLRDYARAGRTVLYSSHVLPEVEQLADQVVIMHRGRLVRHGTLAELTGGRGGLEQVFLSLTAGSRHQRGGPS